MLPRSDPMTAQAMTGDRPSPDEVRGAIGRIVSSETFRASPQLTAFLGFVVEALLRGESKRIKGYTIAVEALGRSHDFDPQADSIVRVVAGRLRRALEQYYASAGATETVVIELPRGSYIPILRRRGPAPVPSVIRAEPAKAPIATPRHRIAALVWIPLIAVGLATIGALGPLSFVIREKGPVAAPESPGSATQMTGPIRAAPVIRIEPFEAIGTPSGPAIAIDRLRHKLADAMARFDALSIITEAAPGEALDKVEYRFTGSAEYHPDDTTTLSFRIVDVGDGAVVWSRVFARQPAEADPAATEEKVVREMAPAIAAPFGVVWARELAAHPTRDSRRACLIETIAYWRSFTLALHEQIRQCLDRLVAADPTFAPGYTGLSLVYLRDFYLGIEHPGDVSSIDLALRAAQHAVELKPYSARAQEALFVVWFARGEVSQAFAIGEHAMALNPYDANVVADYGARLVAIGEIDKGMALLNDAAAHVVARQAWFDAYLFLGAYLSGDQAAAARHAALISSDSVPLGLIARALAAGMAGERDRAKQLIERLVAVVPGWRTDPRRELAKYFPSAAIQDRLLHELDALGLRAMN